MSIISVKNNVISVTKNKEVIAYNIPVSDDNRVVLPSGAVAVYRPVVEVTQVEENFVYHYYHTLDEYIQRFVESPEYRWRTNEIYNKGSKADIKKMLRSMVSDALNRLFRSPDEWDSRGNDFESLCQKNTYKLMDSTLPPRKGVFMPDIETLRRLKFADFLVKYNLTSYESTQPGNPGMTMDKIHPAYGYPVHMMIQPLSHFCASKRFSVARGVSHLLKLRNPEKRFITIKEWKDKPLPDTINALVVGMNIPLDDSVIISKSCAKRLQAWLPNIETMTLDEVINYNGKVYNNWKALKDASDKILIKNGKKVKPVQGDYINTGVSYEAPKVKDYKRYRDIDRVVTPNGLVRYSVMKGKETKDCVDGCKLQSFGDILKGTCVVFEDDDMPYVKVDGTYVPADVICEFSKSVTKHGSAKFAHLSMVLNLVAKMKGGLEVSHDNPLTVEEIEDMARPYYGENLCLEVEAGKYSGMYPAGYIEIGIHRQFPDVVGGAVGEYPAKEWKLELRADKMKVLGKKDGYPDGAIQQAMGYGFLLERRKIPTGKNKLVSIMKDMLVVGEKVKEQEPLSPLS